MKTEEAEKKAMELILTIFALPNRVDEWDSGFQRLHKAFTLALLDRDKEAVKEVCEKARKYVERLPDGMYCKCCRRYIGHRASDGHAEDCLAAALLNKLEGIG